MMCGLSAGAGDNDDRLLHYDGTSWNNYKKEPIHCTGEALYGFNSDDIWMGGGTDGEIWHYDGNEWSENYRYIVEGAHNVGITNIWGIKENDVYACGVISIVVEGGDMWRGFVLHYDGYKWKEVVKTDFNSQFILTRVENNHIYIFALKTSKEVCDTVVFYKLDGNKLLEIFSSPADKIIFGNIRSIDGKVYFLIGQNVYRYINNNFIKQFSLASQNFGYQFYGRNEKDIFIRMQDGLAHYNGTDLQYLFKSSEPINLSPNCVVFEQEIFIPARIKTTGYNVIYHGTLKDN